MPFLGKDILGKSALKRKAVLVDEWGGEVLVRELTGKEAAPIQQSALEIQRDMQANKPNAARMIRWQAETVAAGWINEDGTHVLENGDMESLIEMAGQSTIELLAKEIRMLTGIQRQDGETPIEDAKKNSVTTLNTVSGTS